jgi:hypothetical protein
LQKLQNLVIPSEARNLDFIFLKLIWRLTKMPLQPALRICSIAAWIRRDELGIWDLVL